MNKPKQRKSINLLVADYDTIRRYCFTKNVKMTPWITALALRAIARDKVFKACIRVNAAECNKKKKVTCKCGKSADIPANNAIEFESFLKEFAENHNCKANRNNTDEGEV